MSPIVYVVAAIAAFCVFYFVVPFVVGAFIKYRGKMVLTCPETRKPVGVRVDVGHAAITGVFGEPEIRLKSCTRWPERADCDQECVLQIELAPEDCQIRHMLEKWYEGKSCVFCHRPFGAIRWLEHKPALLGVEGKTVECIEIPPEKLPEALATQSPVCWNCHIAETFRRLDPELVVDRPGRNQSPTNHS